MSIQGDVGNIVTNATTTVTTKMDQVMDMASGIYKSITEPGGFLSRLETEGLTNFTPALVLETIDETINLPDSLGDPTTIGTLPPDPSGPPTYDDPAEPPAPTITFPPAPVIPDIAIPPTPDYATVVFDGIRPVDTSSVPAITINDGGNAYSSSLLESIKTKLRNNIELGGTGLSADVEDDIWERDSERELEALDEAIDKFTDEWTKRGFSLPDGVLVENIRAMNTEYMNKRLDRSRDIAIKQEELEQANMKYSLEYGIQVENMLLDWTNKVCQRVFEHSKAVADAAIEVFKAQVLKYQAGLEAYKADVEVFKGKIQAEIAKAELYKAQIEGVVAQISVYESKAKIYIAQLQGIQSMVEVYVQQVKAMQALIESNKVRIEAYKATIDAYVARVNGIVGKYQAESEVYKARATQWTAETEANIKVLEARIKQAALNEDLKVKQFEAVLRFYAADHGVKVEAAKGAASVAAQVAQGALSAVSTQVSLTAKGDASESYQEQLTSSS